MCLCCTISGTPLQNPGLDALVRIVALLRPRGARAEGALRPIHFGSGPGRLFGCHHIPISRVHDWGIVLCNPMGEEAIRAHRLYYSLARDLCSCGFPVLRFDYYGCGDSGGECEEGSIERWMQDISTAIDTLRATSSVENVCLIGLRLGGALAMLIAGERCDVQALVLWDPVLDGKAYLEEVRRLHRETYPLKFTDLLPPWHRLRTNQLFGYRLPPRLHSSLKKLDLLASVGMVPRQTVWLLGDFETESDLYGKTLTDKGAEVLRYHGPRIAANAPLTVIMTQDCARLVCEWCIRCLT